MSAPTANDSQPILFISSETVCASSIFLAFVTMPEYLFDFANAITMAFPIPLLDPVTTAILCAIGCVYVCIIILHIISDLILSLVLKKITETNGKEHAREIIESIADDLATNIRYEIEKNGHLNNFEESLQILNSVSNDMGFASSITKEHDGSFSVLSKNCILHKVALNHQDVICHGLHERMITKSLSDEKQQQPNTNVELNECIALGDNFSRHAITKKR